MMKYAVYAIYTLSGIGICLAVLCKSVVLAVFCFLACILGIIQEAQLNRGKWPVIGSPEYTKIVDDIENVICKSKEKFHENQRYKDTGVSK